MQNVSTQIFTTCALMWISTFIHTSAKSVSTIIMLVTRWQKDSHVWLWILPNDPLTVCTEEFTK